MTMRADTIARAIGTSANVFRSVASFLADPALAAQVRLTPGAFTRKRVLTLPRMAALMMSSMIASVQAELDSFFGHLAGSLVRERKVSAQAFSQARKHFSAQLFDRVNQYLHTLVAPHCDRFRWQGLRLVAADGSRLRVSTRCNAELKADHYVFAMFLPGSELTLHASLHPADGSERQMLLEALDNLAPDDLLLLDRGYPGATMAAILDQRKIPFVMRVDSAKNWVCVRNFLRSGLDTSIIELRAPDRADAKTYALPRRPTKVRLVRNVTPTGSIGVLITNLLDTERYPSTAFSDLFHQRWRIEEAFKRIKHRLRLEATTGLTYLALQQDFAAKIVADNLCTLAADLQEDLAEPTEPQTDRANRTYALGTLKPILAGCLLGLWSALRYLKDALQAISKARCRVQPDRHYPRKAKHKPHFHRSYKTLS